MPAYIYSIYLITNLVNHKKYVGFTSQNPRLRFNMHKCGAITHKFNVPLYSAIRKYGWDNFSKIVIYQSKDKSHTLKIMEPTFIEIYKSRTTQNGYNCSVGGESGSLGYKYTSEQKSRRSQVLLGNKNSIGHIQTKEHIENKRSAQSKLWEIVYPDGSTIIIKNLKKFCRDNGLNAGHMGLVAAHKRKHHKRFSCIKV